MKAKRYISFFRHGDQTRWAWYCGSSYVVLWPLRYDDVSETWKQVIRFIVPVHEVKGIRPQDFERGKRKATDDGMIKPQDIKQWITKHVGDSELGPNTGIGASRY